MLDQKQWNEKWYREEILLKKYLEGNSNVIERKRDKQGIAYRWQLMISVFAVKCCENRVTNLQIFLVIFGQ